MDFQNAQHLVAAAQKVRAEYLKGAHTTSISVQQKATCRNDPVNGPFWVSKFSLPRPTDDNSRELLLQLIDEANEHQVRYDRPESAPLDFEWVGYRSNVQKDTPEPAIGEQEKFEKLMAETKSPLTILYLYGVHTKLCRPPSIVVAGDSSGSCLALGLLQVLLRLQRRDATITFHGAKQAPVVPAGMSLLSPTADLTNAFPSFERNAYCDIFPTPIEKLPYLEKTFPTCPAWPTRPPRANLYCEAGMLAHPIASPAAADDWTGACPLWLGSGQEQIVDASRLVAREVHRAGGSITLQEYENMPHTFFFVFRMAPQTKQILTEWAQSIVRFGQGERPPSSAQFIRAQGLTAEPLVVEDLVPFTVQQAQQWMWTKTHDYKVPAFHQEGRSSL
ncbi:alpha/beta-hydrolase [Aspergillus pseudonomiae]|uniref:Alpha/beta-hydrolase n=1 Tax=Aspergillus pseudonomiae TaxID=1506151 RepID=A0A5N7DSE3_9EURO|nr:alpha/beta-hydrolase [Aspergillus pseudonomiae]KAE8409390.1 alpha/beta-hydrolase [Aspergillus pseudonomiae]